MWGYVVDTEEFSSSGDRSQNCVRCTANALEKKSGASGDPEQTPLDDEILPWCQVPRRLAKYESRCDLSKSLSARYVPVYLRVAMVISAYLFGDWCKRVGLLESDIV